MRAVTAPPLRAPTWIVPLARELDLTEAQATLLALMLETRSPTQAGLADALRQAGSRAVSASILPAQISKLRDRLRVQGINLETTEDGWRLDAPTRKRLRDRADEIGTPSTSEPPARWRLRGAQELVARMLLQSPVLSRAAFVEALEAGGFSSGSPDVHISRLRDKVAADGLVIDTVVGTGWRFDEQSRARLGLTTTKGATL